MANKKNPAKITPIYNRKFTRSQLKKKVGSDKIQKVWRSLQVNKYGFKEYIMMRFAKTPKNQRNALEV